MREARPASAADVDDAQERYRAHPILGPATRTLANLRDAADANSDGWAYWPKPTRAAAKLMELIERDGTARYLFDGERADVTEAEYRAALRPVKAFRTRSGLAFTIEEPGTPPPVASVTWRGDAVRVAVGDRTVLAIRDADSGWTVLDMADGDPMQATVAAALRAEGVGAAPGGEDE